MAIIHFVNRPKSQTKAGMLFVLRYVTQDKKTMSDGKKYVTGVGCSAVSAYNQFRNTKLMYGKDDGRQYYHFVQSFPPGEEITPEIAHEIALRFASETEKFKGFEIVVATHCDRNHVHSHFVMNSVNADNGKKFHINQRDVEQLMEVSDKLIQEYGLSVLVSDKTQKVKKSISNNEYYALENQNSWKLQLALIIDGCMKGAKSKRHFIWLIEQEGYRVKWTDTRKNITYTCPNGKKCCDDKLHEEKYLKENMEYEFRIREEILCGLQESGNCFDKIGGAGRADYYRNGTELESTDSLNRHAESVVAIPVGADRTASDTTGSQENAAYHADKSYSRVPETADRYADYFKINQEGEREYIDTGWSYERSELLFSRQPENSDDSFYEDAVRDFTGCESGIVVDTLYLAADLQNLIDDDGKIIDCTTRHYPTEKKKQKQGGPVMGGM